MKQFLLKRAFKGALLTMVIAGFVLLHPTRSRAQVAGGAQTAAPGAARFGVNIAGAEFGGGTLPGVHGVNYTYPSASVLEYYRSKGRTLFRLPFHWERLQHSLNGPLDNDELGRLRSVLRAAQQRRMHVILDVHNYGRYRAANAEKSEIIGSPAVPYSAFADLWAKIAAAVKDEPAVYAYGLMNEPHDMGDDARWPRAAQAAIDAIRRHDRKTIIMVAGDGWSSARAWRTGVNKDLNEKVRDPQNNLVFEAHCYFDKDNSGTYKKSYDEEGGSPDGGINYVRPFVEWCREKGVRGLVGEYGVPDTDTRWLVTMDRFLAYLNANNISATYWAGGPWWGKYPLSIEPQDSRVKAETANTTAANTTATSTTNNATATAANNAAANIQSSIPDRPQMLILRQYPG
ncbi:MAG: endoglucanase [Abditibacteriota bacterium]|nr:endoglucanase [Abditibacteriota bacterium]